MKERIATIAFILGVLAVVPPWPRIIKAMTPAKQVIFEGECRLERGLLRADEDRKGMSAGLTCGNMLVRTSDTLVIATCLNRPAKPKCRVFEDGTTVECSQCPPWRLISPARSQYK